MDPNLAGRWRVAEFKDDQVGKFHSTPWIINAGGTLEAAGFWTGTWLDVGQNEVRAEIRARDGSWTDGFNIIFLSLKQFIGVRGGELYRYGKRD